MNKMMTFLEKRLMPIANAFGRNSVLRAIGGGFTMILPVLLIGAIFSLLGGMDVGGYQAWIQGNGLAKVFAIGSNATTNIMALYTVCAVAYQMAKEKGLETSGLLVSFSALMSFFIVTPTLSIEVGENAQTVIDMTYLGAQGLFVSLIIGILTASIFYFFHSRKWTIKMPEGVPSSVAKTFEALMPGIAISIIAILISVLFSGTEYGSIHASIYGILGKPFAAMSGSIITWLVFGLIGNMLWFFGIHGLNVLIPFYFMLWMGPAMENTAAFQAGLPLPHVLTIGMLNVTISGGVGSTLGLAFLLAFRAKSARLKALGKISLLPGIFNINEPITYGFPMVLNPIMLLPFLFIPFINNLLVYLIMQVGLVSAPRLGFLATGSPVILSEFLQCGIGGIVLGVGMIILNIILYYPFFKIQDNIYLREEGATAAAAVEATE